MLTKEVKSLYRSEYRKFIFWSNDLRGANCFVKAISEENLKFRAIAIYGSGSEAAGSLRDLQTVHVRVCTADHRYHGG